MKNVSRIYLWVSGFIWLVAVGYSVWISLIFRNLNQTFPHQFMIGIMGFLLVNFFWAGFTIFSVRLTYRVDVVTLYFVILALASTYIVSPTADKLLVVIPERGGIREAYVIETIGFLGHPFSDKLAAVRLSYTVEADVSVNTDDGKKFIAHSHKKEFRVIDPIAVYHRIGEKDEVIEDHLRDGINRCFYQEMSARQFSNMLVKKAGEPFFIQSRPCELGLTHYGLEPVGGKEISFADFRIGDIPPLRLQIE